MANPAQDPIESLLAEGRLLIQPIQHYGMPDVLTINLELLATTLATRIQDVYINDERIRNRYIGSTLQAAASQAIIDDCTALANYAVGQTYNRLRSILGRYVPSAWTARLNTRCPVPNNQEFPEWLSSTLSCIGPCRFNDGRLIVYASTFATMQHYGRDNPVAFSEGNYARLIGVLRALNFRLAPINHEGVVGSFFSTMSPRISENRWFIYGEVHPSHFENEDCARIALVTSNLGVTPFETVGMTIGYVDDEATLTALAAVPAPAGADSAGRPLGGVERSYQCICAHGVSTTEVQAMLHHRLAR